MSKVEGDPMETLEKSLKVNGATGDAAPALVESAQTEGDDRSIVDIPQTCFSFELIVQTRRGDSLESGVHGSFLEWLQLPIDVTTS